MEPYDLDGVRVEVDSYRNTKEDILTSDLIISHLNRQGYAINVAEFHHKPIVVINHNANGFPAIPAKHQPDSQNRFLYTIYNSEHIKKSLHYPNPSFVLHPPVDADRVKVKKTGKKLTLINCWHNKGGNLFTNLAAMMPDREFLGVRGGYAEKDQVICNLPNVENMDNTPDIKKAYAKTRILLMPSLKESWGMAGVEAMASGIPVIAHPTAGLKESLADAGIFLDRDKPELWAAKIVELDNEDIYKAASAKCVKRFKEIQAMQEKELVDVETWFEQVIRRQL